MNKIFLYIIASFVIVFLSCSKENSVADEAPTDAVAFSVDSEEASADISTSDGVAGSGGNGQGNQQGVAGLVTAGEWNDLDNWSFWNTLINEKQYSDIINYWGVYNNNRLSFLVESNSEPVINADLKLFNGNDLVWEAKTDNLGKAEMWISLFGTRENANIENYSISINEQPIDLELKLFNQGVNTIVLNTNSKPDEKVEMAFIVDATGSMSDELEFLKQDLEDVINRVRNDEPSLQILTSSVFYRDEGDEYVVRKSDFTNDLNTTINFINQQSADGGGNFPEAVHTALNTTLNDLQWSNNAKSKLAFLLLDAPPHYEPQVINELNASIKKAAQRGIKIIPIVASGIDKQTEFLMRLFAMITNGTYVFITDDSGIGNDHLEASVGEYKVEFLNNLIFRLIKKYTE